MSYEIIIDGYNLINKWPEIRNIFSIDSDKGRDELIKYLSNYRKIKKHNIKIIFDAYNSFSLIPSTFSQRGIKIVFTSYGEKADDYIKKIILSAQKDSIMIISSDNEVKHFAEQNGFVAINSEDFIEKVEFAYLSDLKGVYEEDQEYERRIHTKKKGNPHKLPKKIRKKLQKIKKL